MSPCICDTKNEYLLSDGHKYRREGDPLASGETTTVASHQIFPAFISRPKVCCARRGKHGVKGKLVLVKCTDSGSRVFLFNEFECLERAANTGIVPRLSTKRLVHGMQQGDANFYLVTEWFDTEKWPDIAKRRALAPIPHGARRYFVGEMLEVVNKLHSCGIYHGDLKHRHFRVGKGWKDIRLIDFGVAQIGDMPSDNVLLSGGTQGFAMPETGEQLPDRACRRDIYALCATLFYAFTGHCYPLDARIFKDLDENNRKSYETEVQWVSWHQLREDGDLADDHELAQMILDGLWLGYGDSPERQRDGREQPHKLDQLCLGDESALQILKRGRLPMEPRLFTALIISLLTFFVFPVAQQDWALLGIGLALSLLPILFVFTGLPIWISYLLAGLPAVASVVVIGKSTTPLSLAFVAVHLLALWFFSLGKRSWNSFLGWQLASLGGMALPGLLAPSVAVAHGILSEGISAILMPMTFFAWYFVRQMASGDLVKFGGGIEFLPSSPNALVALLFLSVIQGLTGIVVSKFVRAKFRSIEQALLLIALIVIILLFLIVPVYNAQVPLLSWTTFDGIAVVMSAAGIGVLLWSVRGFPEDLGDS